MEKQNKVYNGTRNIPFNEKQDKYTMDPGRQIYLSNNKKFLVKNDF